MVQSTVSNKIELHALSSKEQKSLDPGEVQTSVIKSILRSKRTKHNGKGKTSSGFSSKESLSSSQSTKLHKPSSDIHPPSSRKQKSLEPTEAQNPVKKRDLRSKETKSLC